MTGELRGSGRMAVLRLAADTAQVLGDVANGVVKPSGLRDLTLRLLTPIGTNGSALAAPYKSRSKGT